MGKKVRMFEQQLREKGLVEQQLKEKGSTDN